MSKSLAFHLIFQSDKKTLSDKEVNVIFEKIPSFLSEKGWEIRGGVSLGFTKVLRISIYFVRSRPVIFKNDGTALPLTRHKRSLAVKMVSYSSRTKRDFLSLPLSCGYWSEIKLLNRIAEIVQRYSY